MLAKIKSFFLEQLKQGTTPEGIAWACAVGATCAVFPFVGVTTVMCLAVCYAFKLNHAIAQAVNYAMAAVQLILMPVFLMLGAWVCRVPAVSLSPEAMFNDAWERPQVFLAAYGWAFLQAMLAWAIVAPFFLYLSYKAVLLLVKSLQRVKRQA